MKGYVDDIQARTLENKDFRRVLYTGKNLQLVLMTIPPGEEIGEEVHEDRDQFFRIEEGAVRS
jgi:mannose-6-phosphate isomerase-like protein (cupin superfamily)